jgi:leucyl aminopeptidase
MTSTRTEKLLKLRPASRTPAKEPAPLVAVGVFQDDDTLSPVARSLDDRVDGAFSRVLEAGDFRGKEEEEALFYATGDGPRRVLFVGMGKAESFDRETVRKLAGRVVRRAEALSVTSVHLVVPALSHEEGGAAAAVQAGAEALHLAAFDFRELKDPDPDDGPKPLVTRGLLSVDPGEGGSPPAEEIVEEAIRIGEAHGAGENLARILQFRPGNVATPTHLAGIARELAAEVGLDVRILGPAEMEEEGMGALLSVAAGSDEEPRLIILEYRGGGEDEAPLALVGKGLTFDTGGISLKPPSGMESMKFDMSGGAAVLGAMKAIGMIRPPVNVVGVVPSSENMINGRATKPGDVIRTRAGKTVEVINTDAEGRLILADALSYTVDEYGPRAMVDCATLTGACVVALGHHAAAVLGSDDDLVEALREAGDRSGERCWPLPLWKAYRKQLDSPVADLKNVGGRPAGAITAGLFLSEFVGETPWAHLDIAGTAYGEVRAPYQRTGGFGFPTRLLLEWIHSAHG